MTTAGLAQGRLQENTVWVDDTAQANRLHNKSGVGRPTTGNRLALSIVEAAWCVAEGRLQVGPHSSGDLLGLEGGGRAEVEYLAYADLRERGLSVRHALGQLEVLERGKPATSDAAYAVRAVSERDAVDAEGLLALAERSLVLAVVDEDGAVTHYNTARADPQGSVPVSALPPCSGRLLADRVLVEDEVAARACHEAEFLGTPHGAGLFLSFTEAESLRARGVLSVSSQLPAVAAARQVHFATTLRAYQALRSRSVVAKSGFRFGTHLRGYAGDPGEDHARWLVHCLEDGMHWSELSRAVRLAHGVRKEFLAAVTSRKAVEFVALAWFKP